MSEQRVDVGNAPTSCRAPEPKLSRTAVESGGKTQGAESSSLRSISPGTHPNTSSFHKTCRTFRMLFWVCSGAQEMEEASEQVPGGVGFTQESFVRQF